MIHKVDAHKAEKCSQKKQTSIFNRNSCLYVNTFMPFVALSADKQKEKGME